MNPTDFLSPHLWLAEGGGPLYVQLRRRIEGGIATGLRELAQASRAGIHIDAAQLPVLQEGAMLCEAFGLDPLGTIASGTLLAAVPAEQAERAVAACAAAGIPCARVGTVVANSDELLVHAEGKTIPLPTFGRDEILKLFQT